MKSLPPLLFVVVFAFFNIFLSLWGVTAGLPSQSHTALILPSVQMVRDLSPVLAQLRDDIYRGYEQSAAPRIWGSYVPDRKPMTVTADGREIVTDRMALNALRGGLLQSRFPDEHVLMAAFSAMKPSRLQLNPHVFRYGGAYIYSAGLAVTIAERLGLVTVTADARHYFTHPRDAQRLYAIPRVVGGIFGALGVLAAYGCAAAFYGRGVGLVAALFLAIMPALPVEAHSTKPFAFFVPFMFAALLFAHRILRGGKRRDYILAGVFAGLSAGSLIISGSVVVAAFLAHGFYHARRGERFYADPSACLLAVAGFLGAFFVTNPYWLITPGEVIDEWLWLQSNHFGISPSAIFYHLLHAFPLSTGYPLYILGIAGLVFALVRRTPEDWMILGVFVPAYLYVTGYFWMTPHYSVPLAVLLVVLASRFAVRMYVAAVRFRTLVAGLLLLAAAATLLNTVYYNLLLRNYARLLATTGEWINAHIPAGASLGVLVRADGRETSNIHFSYKGCPPFQLLRYRLTQQAPEYYLAAVYDEPPGYLPSLKGYTRMAAFALDRTPLDAWYRNGLYPFLDGTFSVYIREPDTARP